MVIDALCLQGRMMDYYPPVYARNTGARPRLPSAVLLAVGGHTISLDSGIVAYDFHVHKWIKVDNDMDARYHHGTVFYNVCIYVFGGQDQRNKSLKSVCKFDVGTRTW